MSIGTQWTNLWITVPCLVPTFFANTKCHRKYKWGVHLLTCRDLDLYYLCIISYNFMFEFEFEFLPSDRKNFSFCFFWGVKYKNEKCKKCWSLKKMDKIKGSKLVSANLRLVPQIHVQWLFLTKWMLEWLDSGRSSKYIHDLNISHWNFWILEKNISSLLK